MSKNYVERNTYSELLELDLQEVVSENIKRCVAESGFTAEQLSYRTNLSVATINRLKAGQNLSIHGICALADALNKDLLASGENNLHESGEINQKKSKEKSHYQF